MEVSPVAELIKALEEFEKRIDEIKKDLIKTSTSKLMSKAEALSAELDRFSEEFLMVFIEELNQELNEEKKRIAAQKEKEKETIFEKIKQQAEANLNKAIDEIFTEAKRMLGL